MKHLGHLVAIVLLAFNACTTGLLLFTGYSPCIQPAEHPVLSCAGLAFPIFLAGNACFLAFWLAVRCYKCALLPLAGFLLCYPPMRTYLPVNFHTDRLPEGTCKVLSYNIMGFAGGVKEEGRNPVLDYLKDSGADILCLQEYQVGLSPSLLSQREVDAALKAYPYRRIDYVGRRRSNRMACYSKFPILSAHPLDYPSESNGSMVYELQWGNDTLLLINNHLESNKLTQADKKVYNDLLEDPEGGKVKSGARLLVGKLAGASALRAPQADCVAREIAASPHRYLLVCGDFNDTPISYTHRTLARELDDAFTESGCGLGISYNQNRFYFRIDHLLTSKTLEAYNCTVDRSIKASDHYPIWCHVAKRP